MPSILASNFGVVEQNVAKFCLAARHAAFGTALAPGIQPTPTPVFLWLHLLRNQVMMFCRSYLISAKEQFNYAVKAREQVI
jgi:hypothetical protein